MNTNAIKHAIYLHFKGMYKIEFTQAQLDDINDIYFEAKKESLKDLIVYRFINMMLGVVFLICFMIFVESWTDSWLALLIWTFFVFYNKIHGIINWIQYKRLKQPERPSDEN